MLLQENQFTEKYLKLYIATLGVLVVFGVIMVYSSSYIYAKEVFHSSSYYLIKQVGFLLAGCLIAFVVGKTKISFWLKYSFYFHCLCCGLLMLTLFPVTGLTIKGASRWLNLGVTNFQPSEVVKYSLMLVSVYFFEKFDYLKMNDIIKYIVAIIFPLVVLIMQPDYGSFLICLVVIIFACFMSSFKRKIFYSILGSGIFLILITIFTQPYRVKRILAFMDPWKNARTSGFQIIQSYLAFANGAFWGQGLGNSNEKLFYLPEAHNDFIFSVLAEELGFIGVLITVILFLLLIYWGFNLVISLPQKTFQILVSSVVFLIGFQALINMGVVLGMLPTKGLNLPFISYGGSSIVANFFGLGLMIAVANYSKKLHQQ